MHLRTYVPRTRARFSRCREYRRIPSVEIIQEGKNRGYARIDKDYKGRRRLRGGRNLRSRSRTVSSATLVCRAAALCLSPHLFFLSLSLSPLFVPFFAFLSPLHTLDVFLFVHLSSILRDQQRVVSMIPSSRNEDEERDERVPPFLRGVVQGRVYRFHLARLHHRDAVAL